MQARHVAASVPSPSPEAAEDVGSLGDDDLDIEAPVTTPKQGRALSESGVLSTSSTTLLKLKNENHGRGLEVAARGRGFG